MGLNFPLLEILMFKDISMTILFILYVLYNFFIIQLSLKIFTEKQKGFEIQLLMSPSVNVLSVG